jgi:hypothetical protein
MGGITNPTFIYLPAYEWTSSTPSNLPLILGLENILELKIRV